MYQKLAKENFIGNAFDLAKLCTDMSEAMVKDDYNHNRGFIITITRVTSKNNLQQLRGYWRIIRVIKEWMNSQGNHFTDEQVSDYFKVQAGHCNTIRGVSIPKSIALNSKTTAEEMFYIIDEALEFGKRFDIPDCNITPQERADIQDYYSQYQQPQRVSND